MEPKNNDQVFFVNFAKVLGVLLGIAFICVIAARLLVPADEHRHDPEAQVQLEERIKPVASVVTDPSVLVKLAAAEQATRPAMSGEEVYHKICAGCHATGVLNAPKIGDKAAWTERQKAAGGFDGMLKIAIHGLNAMPPRGGDASLSDDELKGAIKHMLEGTGL